MDRLSVMKAYCRIVERGSFAKASEDLGVSPGLLSREIKLLEDSLGCTLITRTTRSMSLTEQGKAYYEEAQFLLDAFEQAEERVRASAGSLRGSLRINAPHSFGAAFLSPLLPEFLERYPDIELTLAFDDRVVDMVEGGFDLTIRIRSELPDSGLRARKIATVKVGLFAAPSYLEKHGVPETPEELTKHKLLDYLHADTPGTWTLNGPERTDVFSFASNLRISSSFVLRDLMIAGHGICALPDFLSQSVEQSGELVRVLPEWSFPERNIYAVFAGRRGADVRTHAFVDFLTDTLSCPV